MLTLQQWNFQMADVQISIKAGCKNNVIIGSFSEKVKGKQEKKTQMISFRSHYDVRLITSCLALSVSVNCVDRASSSSWI